MKNSNLSFLILTVLILISISINVKAQQVKGDGNIVNESRAVSSFDNIESNGVINVTLIQGDTESVIVEADRNLIPYILTKVKDNKLIISTNEDIDMEQSKKINVLVTLKSIDKLELNGVGNLESQNQLKLTDLIIENNGVGNLKLNLDCDKLKLENNSVGNSTLSGKVSNVKIEHNGVGNIKAFDLSADVLKIESNAVGNAEVNSDKEIYINLNGMGNVSYKGNAVVKELNKSGLGNVTKM